MPRLTKKEQAVIHKRFIEGKTLNEVAKDMGVTRERIRQLEAKAFRKIRKNFPEETCDDCYYYWGVNPTCHHFPTGRKDCIYFKPKLEAKEPEEDYQDDWN